MIRLKSLLPASILQEISLASVTPYATQFVWRDNWGDGESFEAKFEADSQPITMTMALWKSSKFSDSGEWQFAYFVRTADDDGWTTTTAHSGARGELNTLRLFRTIGEAIRDFAAGREGVDVIDITGSDMHRAKGAQKSRIYTEFLRTNPNLAEFDVVPTGRGLYLVRKGVTKTEAPEWTEDPDAYDAVDDDSWTPDGSETDDDDDDMGWTTDMSFGVQA